MLQYGADGDQQAEGTERLMPCGQKQGTFKQDAASPAPLLQLAHLTYALSSGLFAFPS